MYIKTLITGLMLSMLLSSGAANADWGDVYYCQMTNFIYISLEGKQINYTPEKFQFKLDQTRRRMVFGSTGFFEDSAFQVESKSSQEMWFAKDIFSSIYFKEGKFLYTSNGAAGAQAASADCDKF